MPPYPNVFYCCVISNQSRYNFKYFEVLRQISQEKTKTRQLSSNKTAFVGSILQRHTKNNTRKLQFMNNFAIFEEICPFKQYTKSKPGRQWIQIWTVVDFKRLDFYNLRFYTGKSPGCGTERISGFQFVSLCIRQYSQFIEIIEEDHF